MPDSVSSPRSNLGLNPARELVIAWQWLPRAPLPLDQRLPDVCWRDAAAFVLADELRGPEAAAVEAAYRFGFAQLARQTPDLRFYRLVQLLNTPLLSVTTRDAGRSGYAYWGGVAQEIPADHRVAHLWFFDDATDGDLVVVEYAFNGSLVLRSQKKAPELLRERYEAICARVREAPT
jgi:hypothetical protein